MTQNIIETLDFYARNSVYYRFIDFFVSKIPEFLTFQSLKYLLNTTRFYFLQSYIYYWFMKKPIKQVDCFSDSMFVKILLKLIKII